MILLEGILLCAVRQTGQNRSGKKRGRWMMPTGWRSASLVFKSDDLLYGTIAKSKLVAAGG